jgi:hypothetical protein
MKPIPVSVINSSKVLKDAEIAAAVPALQIQVSEHLAPRWHIDAALEFVPTGKQPSSSGNWRLEILDDTDYPPDSGYHNVGSDGIPYGRVFVNTVRQYKESWTITASHELLEMLVNPYVYLAAYVPFDGDYSYSGTFCSLEICDPVSPDANGYKINGIDVSDFVFPEWFSPFLARPGADQSKQVDYCKHLADPAPVIGSGTTISVFGWRDLQSQQAAGEARRGKDVASLLNKASRFAIA